MYYKRHFILLWGRTCLSMPWTVSWVRSNVRVCTMFCHFLLIGEHVTNKLKLMQHHWYCHLKLSSLTGSVRPWNIRTSSHPDWNPKYLNAYKEQNLIQLHPDLYIQYPQSICGSMNGISFVCHEKICREEPAAVNTSCLILQVVSQ